MKLIVIIYLLVMFLVGVWANKYNKTMTDFLLAGRSLGIILSVFTLTATYFGGGFVIGLSEASYNDGLISWWNGIAGGIGLILVGFMAYKMRDLALFTIPDYLMIRYNNNGIRLMSSILSLIALIGILAAQVNAAAGIFSILGFGSGITPAVLSSFIFIGYTAIGGLMAATLTDAIQISIASGGVIFAFFITVSKIGGWPIVMNNLKTLNVSPYYMNILGDLNFTVILWLTLPMILYTLIGQDVYQRIFATKDPKTARGACMISGIAIIILTLFPVLLGIIGKTLYPNIDNPRFVLPKIIIENFPPLICGIVLAAILAAIMSTADSILTASTSHVINDIYIKTIGGDDSIHDKKMLKFSRICTVLIGIFAIGVSVLTPKIVTLLLYSYTLYTGAVFIPVVGGFIWKKANKNGAIAAMITGTFISVLNILGYSFFGIPNEILSGVISLLVFIGISIITQNKKYN